MEEFESRTTIHSNRWYWGESEYVIYDGGKGVVSVQFQDDYPDTATISCLSVLPQFRKTGIGTRLVKFAENEARKRGKRRVELGTERGSFLVEWYKRMGYREISTLGDDRYAEYNDDRNIRIVCLEKDI